MGRLVARTDALGQRVTMERDAAGRLVRRTTPDGDYVYSYDAAGQLAAAVGPESVLEYTRDRAGRVVAESVDGRVVRSDYDGAGRRVLRSTPGGAVSEWAYDRAGNPSALATDAGRLAFTVDAVGHEVERVLDGKVFLSRQHDAAGRLTAQRLWTGDAGGSAAEMLHREWFRPADGMPIRLDDSRRGRTQYEVDAYSLIATSSADGSYFAVGRAALAFTPVLRRLSYDACLSPAGARRESGRALRPRAGTSRRSGPGRTGSRLPWRRRGA